jgi:hypothetical protein
MMLRCSSERSSKGQADGPRLSVLAVRRRSHGRDVGRLRWFIAPEPPDLKLARIRAGLDLSMPGRTLPPEVKALRCMMVWIGTAGPEIWCPAAPPLPEEQAPPAVPTSITVAPRIPILRHV